MKKRRSIMAVSGLAVMSVFLLIGLYAALSDMVSAHSDKEEVQGAQEGRELVMRERDNRMEDDDKEMYEECREMRDEHGMNTMMRKMMSFSR